MEKPTFEKLPEMVAEIIRKLDIIYSLLEPAPKRDSLMTIEELQEFLPERPARQTIYQWVNDWKIPFEKHGRRLYFRKSVISEWLENARRITNK